MMTLQDRINAITWYHSIDLGNGIITPGMMSQERQQPIADAIPQDLTGKSVLDIGAWDGYYSFLAEKRGARRVVSLEPNTLGDPLYHQTDDGFLLAKEVLGSKVERSNAPLEELRHYVYTFDVVFFFGIYYHLKDPILGFDIVCKLTKELLLVEGDALFYPAALMFYDFDEKDPSRAWRFTKPLISQMVYQRGFKSVEEIFAIPISRINVKSFPLYPNMPDTPAFSAPAGRVFWRCVK